MKREEELEFISVNASEDDFSMNQRYASNPGGVGAVNEMLGGFISKQSKVNAFSYTIV